MNRLNKQDRKGKNWKLEMVSPEEIQWNSVSGQNLEFLRGPLRELGVCEGWGSYLGVCAGFSWQGVPGGLSDIPVGMSESNTVLEQFHIPEIYLAVNMSGHNPIK